MYRYAFLFVGVFGFLSACRAQDPSAPRPEPRVEGVRSEAGPTLDRDTLLALGRVEDQVRETFEAAIRRWQENTEDPKLAEQKRLREAEYRAILRLSDEAVERYFTPERIAAIPWTDLLAGDQARSWIASAVEGFEHRIENGVLHLNGPAPHVSGEAILSIGDREQWRDLVLDVEFTLVSGECTLWLRLPRGSLANAETLALSADAYALGVSHALVVSLIGSTRTEEPSTTKVSWIQSRKGALGISIPRNSEVRFTRLRAKILR